MKSGFIRINIVGIFATIIWLCIVAKLLHIQVVEGKLYEAKALNQHSGSMKEPALRGTIFDRNYRKLALDLEYYDFYATPYNVEKPKNVSQFVSKVTGVSNTNLLRKLNSKAGFVYLARNVDMVRAKQLSQRKLRGVGSQKVYHRYYPYGKLAGQILGCTDIDNKPLTGVDLKYNKHLNGVDGESFVKYDGKGRIIPDLSKNQQKPVRGKDIFLTIDLRLQQIAENELEKGVKDFKAKDGTSVIMNPFTGEILAMATYPDFDPNKAKYYNSEVKKVKAITDIFEPGSTFKFVTSCAAIEENVQKPDDKINCENGVIRVHNLYIRDTKKNKTLTFQEVFEKSSNVGIYKIAKKVGKETLFKYARNFGFGKETGIDLIGEVPGLLKIPREWSGISIAEIPRGYEVAVTSLQLTNAYSAIANGGNLMKPYIVKNVVDGERVIWSAKPEIVRRVVTKRTADILTAFMEGVVKRGTRDNASIEGIRIAGKTGTAQKILQDRKGYSKTDYISSFVGFFPVENPLYVIFIKIDTPKGKYYGADVAAPIFKKIAEKILLLPKNESYEKRHLVETIEAEKVRIPDLRNLSQQEALTIANSLNIKTQIEGYGEVVVSQTPMPGKDINQTESITLIVDTLKGHERMVVTPDVIGMSARKAINELAYYGIDFKIAGKGSVKKQIPKPGQKVLKGSVSYLDCSPALK